MDGDGTMLVDTLIDLRLTNDMLTTMTDEVERICILRNTVVLG